MESILPTPRCSCDGCSCGLAKKQTELKEKKRTYKFLMRLDDQFSVIKTQILAMKPAPKLSIVYHLVVEDEQQHMITALKKPVREVVAFQASNMSVNDSWVMDSGAIEHITHQGYLLKNLFMNTTERPVTIPNGESIPVKGKGSGCGELDWISDCCCSLYWIGGIKEERKVMAVTIDAWHKQPKGFEQEIFEYSNPISQYDDLHYSHAKNIENNKEEQTHSMEEVLQEQPEDLVEEKENMQSDNVHVENMHMENHVEPPVI
uniref:Metallophosphoesterase domain-containing protein n=1 Tax=Tanacetum cinerariifolium TaxID=118510 RepID=A0A6L2P2R4_TANCI|nr:metallophosphoesterase domain-containing protein [Tanacetum cinerariifolium]